MQQCIMNLVSMCRQCDMIVLPKSIKAFIVMTIMKNNASVISVIIPGEMTIMKGERVEIRENTIY